MWTLHGRRYRCCLQLILICICKQKDALQSHNQGPQKITRGNVALRVSAHPASPEGSKSDKQITASPVLSCPVLQEEGQLCEAPCMNESRLE